MSWNWGFLRGGAYRLPAFVQCKIALAFMCVCRKVYVLLLLEFGLDYDWSKAIFPAAVRPLTDIMPRW